MERLSLCLSGDGGWQQKTPKPSRASNRERRGLLLRHYSKKFFWQHEKLGHAHATQQRERDVSASVLCTNAIPLLLRRCFAVAGIRTMLLKEDFFDKKGGKGRGEERVGGSLRGQ